MICKTFYSSRSQNIQFMLVKKHTFKEIIPESIAMHGTSIMRQTEVELFGIIIDQNVNLISMLIKM